MFLLYSDEAGQHDSKYFVLAGVAIFERQVHWLISALEQIQIKYLPAIQESVEFHASAIRSGYDKPWKNLDEKTRRNLLDEIYSIIAESDVILFASVVEREWLNANTNEYEFAFESLVNRFDRFLRSKYKDEGEAHRGLIIIAESQYRQRIETLSVQIRKVGTRWGAAYNLADIPLFTPSSSSRLLQVADFCANAIYGKFEGGYGKQYDKICSKFFQVDKVFHGLAHYSKTHDQCMCQGCITRRLEVSRTGVQPPPDIQPPQAKMI